MNDVTEICNLRGRVDQLRITITPPKCLLGIFEVKLEVDISNLSLYENFF